MKQKSKYLSFEMNIKNSASQWLHDYGEKVDLIKGYWNPKRKMWVTMHFSEIIKQP